MISNPALGTVVAPNTIRFDLRYPHPRDAVWRAVTDPAALEVWFMPMAVDLRQGGAVKLWYRGPDTDVPAEGVVTELAVGSLVQYHFDAGPWQWPAGDLRFEISDAAGGARLVFTQTIAPDTVWHDDPVGQIGGPGSIHPGACAGWQGFFQEGLDRFLDGRPDPIYDDGDDSLMASRAQEYAALLRRLSPTQPPGTASARGPMTRRG